MKVGERQHLSTVAGLDGFWAVRTGGDTDRSIEKVYDGGAEKPDLIIGDTESGDVTVSRPFDTMRDGPIYARLNELLKRGGSFFTTISEVDTAPDFSRAGDPRTWQGELKTVRAPEGNRTSTTAKRLELIFVVQ